MQKNKNRFIAFTLVELIVVITILSVLATIGFVSYQGYGMSSRDAVRLSDMSNIVKGLSVQVSKGEKLPIPEDKIDITASGTILNYQGYVGKQTLGNIGINGEGIDPLTKNYYTYSVDFALNNFQILGFFEQGQLSKIINETYANFEDKYPYSKGSDLGILLNATTKEPIQSENNDIDIFNTTQEYNIFINNLDNQSIGAGKVLSAKLDYRFNERGSCYNLLKNGYSQGSGRYAIVGSDGNEIVVYCDMEIDGGGWTMFSSNGYSLFGDYATSGIINYGEITPGEIGTIDISGFNFYGIMAHQFLNNNYIIFENLNKDIFLSELDDRNGETSNSLDAQTDLGLTLHKGSVSGYNFSQKSPITTIELHHIAWNSQNQINWMIENGTRSPGRSVVNNLSFSNHGGRMKDREGNVIQVGTYGLFFR